MYFQSVNTVFPDTVNPLFINRLSVVINHIWSQSRLIFHIEYQFEQIYDIYHRSILRDPGSGFMTLGFLVCYFFLISNIVVSTFYVWPQDKNSISLVANVFGVI